MNSSHADNQTQLLIQFNTRCSRILSTYKAHEAAADRLVKLESCRKGASIVLTALSAVTFVIPVLETVGLGRYSSVVVSGIALAATMIALSSDSVDWRGRAEQHSHAARDLRRLHLEYQSLMLDFRVGRLTLEEALEKRDKLARKEYKVLSRISVRVKNSDSDKAEKKIDSDTSLQMNYVLREGE